MSRALVLLVAMSACSSLVDDPCANGYMLQGNRCVERIAPDSGDIDRPMPDGPVTDGPIADGPLTDGPISDGAVTDGPLTDASPDGPVTPDALVDAPPDALVDAPPDASVDAPPDALVDASPDASPDAGVDAPLPPDAPICAAPSKICGGTCTDVTSDPQDCGTCGHVCASGICTAGACVGELAGHIVAIGHDYQQHNVAMARVLGNAAALASSTDLGIAHVTGTATLASRTGTTASLASSLTAIGRISHAVALPAVGAPLTGIDVLVIDAQTGDGAVAEALGVQWKGSRIHILVVRVLAGYGWNAQRQREEYRRAGRRES